MVVPSLDHLSRSTRRIAVHCAMHAAPPTSPHAVILESDGAAVGFYVLHLQVAIKPIMLTGPDSLTLMTLAARPLLSWHWLEFGEKLCSFARTPCCTTWKHADHALPWSVLELTDLSFASYRDPALCLTSMHAQRTGKRKLDLSVSLAGPVCSSTLVYEPSDPVRPSDCCFHSQSGPRSAPLGA
jgi:hypothetical protein